MRFNRSIVIAALLAVGIAFSAATPTTNFQCGEAKEFKLGPNGGSFTLDHSRVVAPKGALKNETTFTIRSCPGSLGNEDLAKVLPTFEKTAEGERGERITNEKLFASSTYPSVEIKSKETLEVADGQWLHYCLVGSENAPANSHVIFHDEKTAPVALDHTPTTQEHCVRFRSLSLFHHFTHWVKHTANKVSHEAKKDAHKVDHEVKKDADKAGHEIAKDAKKAGKAIEDLVNPCHMCKKAVGAGTSGFMCKAAAKEMIKQYEKCNVEVDEAEPELAEYSPAICGAIEASFKIACNAATKNPIAQKGMSTFSNEVCHKAHLCG